mmetsp:Transcript_20031/g.29698  ORF Transcript_20031/g.29698 Transcript_20031/m.29698 type:complete len:672 (-) Transcript_20031:136-2151(-)|eukprot:CAMPEP_0194202190 /NCGR_PEP_ID=MMETSP0156-20130528/2275_1 /TAXON_ID=33649 /ORGANISM="Thalassionema nitzschioides, Strain L26-B" /LENGTH=671 /DNA_ID=CAMNT_0038927613 /DNA_START=531 /DNA_END=2546 /DNA_ORIENTATION=-
MASSILYKFRSATTFEALPLPGTAARLFDVKKAVVKAKRLDVGGMDFELEVHDATTNQQYVDESMLLPRGTRLIVRRVGAARGQGFVTRMQRAESGMMTTNQSSKTAVPTGFYTIESHGDDEEEFVSTNKRDDEKELAALMAATNSTQNPISSTRPARSSANAPRPAGSGPPPLAQGRPRDNFNPRQHAFRPNADPELRAQEQQAMPKKRATGIPRTFLNLSAPPVTDGLNAEGETENVPRLQPNALGFEELVNRGGGQSENASGTKKDLDYALKLTATTIPEHLQCGLCQSVVKNAMLLPWDLEGRTTCETCIRDGLTQSGFRCPLTGNEGVSPDDLLPNMPLRKAADVFIQGVMEKMEEINQQQVDEPDQDNEAALSSKEFDGDSGEKGVIVSKKTRLSFKRSDNDDPFGDANDDFGGDVFDVGTDKQDEPDADVVDDTDERPLEKVDDSNTEESKAQPLVDTNAPLVQREEEQTSTEQVKDEPSVNEAEKDRREARKQRALPTGYMMGPAGGATAAPAAHESDRSDGGYRNRGRGGGRGWERGGFRGNRGRGGRGGRFVGGGRGRFDDYDTGGRSFQSKGYNDDDRYEAGYDDDHRGTKRARTFSGEGGEDQQRHSRDFRNSDDWDGGGGRVHQNPPAGRFDDRRGPPRFRGRGRGYRGRGGYGRGRY